MSTSGFVIKPQSVLIMVSDREWCPWPQSKPTPLYQTFSWSWESKRCRWSSVWRPSSVWPRPPSAHTERPSCRISPARSWPQWEGQDGPRQPAPHRSPCLEPPPSEYCQSSKLIRRVTVWELHKPGKTIWGWWPRCCFLVPCWHPCRETLLLFVLRCQGF